MRVTQLAMMIGLVAACAALAAPPKQYWDAAKATGYQHGDGNWSLSPADTNWTLNGTSLCSWTNGNHAYFNGASGYSTVLVDGASLTSYWFSVGGSGYDIIITNGASIKVGTSEFILGYGALASDNTISVYGGAGVTSRLDCGASSIGRPGLNNSLLVDGMGFNNSAVFQSSSMSIGFGGTPSSRVIIRRGGVWNPGNSTVNLGNSASSNELAIEAGGRFVGGIYIGKGGSDNTFRVSGSNALATITTLVVSMGGGHGDRCIIDGGAMLSKNTATFIIGNGGTASFFAVTNGGKLVSAAVPTVGYSGASACTALVAGVSSEWDNGSKNMIVGDNASNNVMKISSNGLVTNAAAIQIGSGAAGLGNCLVVAGGGRLYSKTTDSAIGYTAGTSGNTARVTGNGSLWNLGGRSLTVGTATGPGNALTVEDSGAVTNVNLLRVHANNTLNLLGGSVSANQVTLGAEAVTVAGIAGDSGPGAGWGQLVSSGSHTLGGMLKPVLQSDFKPLRDTAFVIMANTGGSISGTFSNAGDGDTIPAYDEDLVTPVGEFTVSISATAVTLHFLEPPGGTILLIR